MKIIALFFFLTWSAFAANIEYHPPLDILKRDGELALSDTVSYFVFSQDGTFRSFPVGMSGRMLSGKWTAKETNPVFLTVIAKVGWMNGAQPVDDYRKIVFVIYGGYSSPSPPNASPSIKSIYHGYFIIDEFIRIPPPKSALVGEQK